MATKCFPKPSLDATRQPPKNKDLTPTSPATKKHLPSVDKDIEPSKFDQEQRNNELEIVSGSELRSREDAQIRPFVQFFDQECYRMSGPLIDLYNDTKSFRVPWATKMSLDLLLEMCQKENNNNSKYKETTILQMEDDSEENRQACYSRDKTRYSGLRVSANSAVRKQYEPNRVTKNRRSEIFMRNLITQIKLHLPHIFAGGKSARATHAKKIKHMLVLIDGELRGLPELTEDINSLELSETNTGKALPDTQSGILEDVTMGEQQGGIKYEGKEDMPDSLIKNEIKDEIEDEFKVKVKDEVKDEIKDEDLLV
ncbi:hypothetical protein N7513_001111 [Penicillium frequentans]|nr:hypothetical protein N7513_001111 [Penicillium glabrum]